MIHHLLQVAQWVLEEDWEKGVREGRKRVGKGRKGNEERTEGSGERKEGK